MRLKDLKTTPIQPAPEGFPYQVRTNFYREVILEGGAKRAGWLTWEMDMLRFRFVNRPIKPFRDLFGTGLKWNKDKFNMWSAELDVSKINALLAFCHKHSVTIEEKAWERILAAWHRTSRKGD